MDLKGVDQAKVGQALGKNKVNEVKEMESAKANKREAKTGVNSGNFCGWTTKAGNPGTKPATELYMYVRQGGLHRAAQWYWCRVTQDAPLPSSRPYQVLWPAKNRVASALGHSLDLCPDLWHMKHSLFWTCCSLSSFVIVLISISRQSTSISHSDRDWFPFPWYPWTPKQLLMLAIWWACLYHPSKSLGFSIVIYLYSFGINPKLYW